MAEICAALAFETNTINFDSGSYAKNVTFHYDGWYSFKNLDETFAAYIIDEDQGAINNIAGLARAQEGFLLEYNNPKWFYFQSKGKICIYRINTEQKVAMAYHGLHKPDLYTNTGMESAAQPLYSRIQSQIVWNDIDLENSTYQIADSGTDLTFSAHEAVIKKLFDKNNSSYVENISEMFIQLKTGMFLETGYFTNASGSAIVIDEHAIKRVDGVSESITDDTKFLSMHTYIDDIVVKFASQGVDIAEVILFIGLHVRTAGDNVAYDADHDIIALPANDVGVEYILGTITKIEQFCLINDEAVRDISFSLDGDVSRLILKAGESRSESDLEINGIQIISTDNAGGEEYRISLRGTNQLYQQE